MNGDPDQKVLIEGLLRREEIMLVVDMGLSTRKFNQPDLTDSPWFLGVSVYTRWRDIIVIDWPDFISGVDGSKNTDVTARFCELEQKIHGTGKAAIIFKDARHLMPPEESPKANCGANVTSRFADSVVVILPDRTVFETRSFPKIPDRMH